MTSQIDPIQALIDQIDGTLSHPVSWLPWAASGQIRQQRQVLQQVRDYLVMQRSLTRSAHLGDEPAALNQSEANAQQVLQSVVCEMNELRSTLLRPLQTELITLTQQRTALMHDVRRLEAHKQSQLLESSNPSNLTSSQVDELQRVHDRADQVLATLDTTIKAVFDSLQQDIKAYQASLSQGLDKLHGLGEQGEVLFAALVNRLVQQLGHEASYLPPQPSQEAVSFQLTPMPTSSVSHPTTAPTPSQTVFDPAKISLPYPGTELPSDSYIPKIFLQSDSIHTLTDLLEQLPPEIEEAPNTLVESTPVPEKELLPQPLSTQNAELDLQID